MSKDNAERLNSLVDNLCRGDMYDAANKHRMSVATFPLRDKPHDANHAYNDFIEGWRAAMTLRFPELLEENEQLRGVVKELCTRLKVLPKGKAERIVKRVIKETTK